MLVDGHGLLHPRKCGLACYVGIMLDKPTIGVAKSILYGNMRPDGYIEADGEILGCRIGKLYVSVGHKISLDTAIAFVKGLVISPLKLADINSKAQRMKKSDPKSGFFAIFDVDLLLVLYCLVMITSFSASFLSVPSNSILSIYYLYFLRIVCDRIEYIVAVITMVVI